MPPRLHRLPAATVTPRGFDVRVAATVHARLLGLAGLRCLAPCVGLLFPGTRSIHTCFMRFAVDLVWLDSQGRILRVDAAVAPWRLRCCRRARSVVELRAGIARPWVLRGLRVSRE